MDLLAQSWASDLKGIIGWCACLPHFFATASLFVFDELTICIKGTRHKAQGKGLLVFSFVVILYETMIDIAKD